MNLRAYIVKGDIVRLQGKLDETLVDTALSLSARNPALHENAPEKPGLPTTSAKDTYVTRRDKEYKNEMSIGLVAIVIGVVFIALVIGLIVALLSQGNRQ